MRTAWLIRFLVITGVLAAAGCDSTVEEAVPLAAPVRAATAIEGPAAPPIRTYGLLANADEIRLSFKVGGVIKSLPVQAGEQVRKGQKLAEIEQTEVDAQVQQARQAYEKARRDSERGKRLHADKVISLEQLQDLRTQAAMAKAALSSAQFNRGYATIIAPRDGTVLRRLAEERELVEAGKPILVLGAQDTGFVVRTGLADREVVQVRLGDAAQIRLDALPDARLTGEITEIASAADASTGMFGIEVALDPADLPLRSGLVARLTIVPSSAKAGARVYVPIASIVEGNGREARVFVLQGQRAQRRDVDVAFIEGESVALASGVAAGERVITDGAQYLRDGEPVAVLGPAADTPAEATRLSKSVAGRDDGSFPAAATHAEATAGAGRPLPSRDR